jgi:hypothetical protein
MATKVTTSQKIWFPKVEKSSWGIPGAASAAWPAASFV